jgi:hypothetical protein
VRGIDPEFVKLLVQSAHDWIVVLRYDIHRLVTSGTGRITTDLGLPSGRINQRRMEANLPRIPLIRRVSWTVPETVVPVSRHRAWTRNRRAPRIFAVAYGASCGRAAKFGCVCCDPWWIADSAAVA